MFGIPFSARQRLDEIASFSRQPKPHRRDSDAWLMDVDDTFTDLSLHQEDGGDDVVVVVSDSERTLKADGLEDWFFNSMAQGKENAVKHLLLSYDVDMDTFCQGLSFAVLNDQIDFVTSILQPFGGEFLDNEQGCMVLSDAVASDNVRMMNILYNHGARPTCENFLGMWFAIRDGNMDMINLLFSYGYNSENVIAYALFDDTFVTPSIFEDVLRRVPAPGKQLAQFLCKRTLPDNDSVLYYDRFKALLEQLQKQSSQWLVQIQRTFSSLQRDGMREKIDMFFSVCRFAFYYEMLLEAVTRDDETLVKLLINPTIALARRFPLDSFLFYDEPMLRILRHVPNVTIFNLLLKNGLSKDWLFEHPSQILAMFIVQDKRELVDVMRDLVKEQYAGTWGILVDLEALTSLVSSENEWMLNHLLQDKFFIMNFSKNKEKELVTFRVYLLHSPRKMEFTRMFLQAKKARPLILGTAALAVNTYLPDLPFIRVLLEAGDKLGPSVVYRPSLEMFQMLLDTNAIDPSVPIALNGQTSVDEMNRLCTRFGFQIDTFRTAIEAIFKDNMPLLKFLFQYGDNVGQEFELFQVEMLLEKAAKYGTLHCFEYIYLQSLRYTQQTSLLDTIVLLLVETPDIQGRLEKMKFVLQESNHFADWKGTVLSATERALENVDQDMLEILLQTNGVDFLNPEIRSRISRLSNEHEELKQKLLDLVEQQRLYRP